MAVQRTALLSMLSWITFWCWEIDSWRHKTSNKIRLGSFFIEMFDVPNRPKSFSWLQFHKNWFIVYLIIPIPVGTLCTMTMNYFTCTYVKYVTNGKVRGFWILRYLIAKNQKSRGQCTYIGTYIKIFIYNSLARCFKVLHFLVCFSTCFRKINEQIAQDEIIVRFVSDF